MAVNVLTRTENVSDQHCRDTKTHILRSVHISVSLAVLETIKQRNDMCTGVLISP